MLSFSPRSLVSELARDSAVTLANRNTETLRKEYEKRRNVAGLGVHKNVTIYSTVQKSTVKTSTSLNMNKTRIATDLGLGILG